MNAQIYEAQRDLTSAGIPATSSSLRNKLLGIGEREKTLLEVFEYHNKQAEILVGKEFSPNPFMSYRVKEKMISEEMNKIRIKLNTTETNHSENPKTKAV